MTDTKIHPPLPKTLRPETLTRLSLACRLGWHQWQFGESFGHSYQWATCMKCGRRVVK